MELKKIKKVGIIGVGFMGGSLALALKDKYKNMEIIGYARSQSSFNRLRKFKFLDQIERKKEKVARQADLLILAVPVGRIVELVAKLAPFLKKGTIVFDLGSTKAAIEKAARAAFAQGVSFVGCHPLCGSEKTGAQAAQADLYQGSLCFITSNNKASFLVEKMWKKIGSKVIRVKPFVHDQITCAISHLPHLICFSLVNAVDNKYFKFSSSGFKDLTRIASSSSQLWADIFLTNKDKILTALGRNEQILNQFKTAIKAGDKDKLKKLIKKANQKRNKIA